MAVVSTQDRVMAGLGMSVLPLALAGILLAFKKPGAAAVFGGIGVAAGVFGAVGAEMFIGPPGPNPLASKGWKDGYPSGSYVPNNGIVGPGTPSWSELNQGIVDAGGYAYSDEAFKPAPKVAGDDAIIRTRVDSKPLSGIGGFWSYQG